MHSLGGGRKRSCLTRGDHKVCVLWPQRKQHWHYRPWVLTRRHKYILLPVRFMVVNGDLQLLGQPSQWLWVLSYYLVLKFSPFNVTLSEICLWRQLAGTQTISYIVLWSHLHEFSPSGATHLENVCEDSWLKLLTAWLPGKSSIFFSLQAGFFVSAKEKKGKKKKDLLSGKVKLFCHWKL